MSFYYKVNYLIIKYLKNINKKIIFFIRLIQFKKMYKTLI